MLRKRTIINDFSDEDKEDNIENNCGILFNNSYKVVIICFQYTFKTMKIFINISGIYLLWIFLHFLASQLYVKMCVPNTLIGFFMSPFMTATPHCQGLRWIIYNSGSMINNMWIILGAWICSTILIVNNNNSNSQAN